MTDFQITVTIKPPERDEALEKRVTALIGFLKQRINFKTIPIKTQIVCKYTGIRNARELREVVSYARGHGALIGSRPGKNGGYWLGATLADVEETTKSQKKAARSLLWAIYSMERGAKSEGQMVLEL